MSESLRRDEAFLDHPAEHLAQRLDILLRRGDNPGAGAVLKVIAEWLDDVELHKTVIVRTHADPDWHPQGPDLAALRRDIHLAADRRTSPYWPTP